MVMMVRIVLLTVISFLLGCAVATAQSQSRISPFFTSNLSPVIHIYGLPATEGGEIVATKEVAVRVVAEVASHYSTKDTASELVLFDGETSRVVTSLRYGLKDRWEVGVDVPLISHDGGVLDGFIEGWHDFFGLPQSGRDEARRDQLSYYYQRNESSPALDYSGSNGGIGDLSLSVAYQLFAFEPDARRALALRTGIKLPTGDSDRMRGSGGTDLHIRLTGSDAQTLKAWNSTLFASAGVLWLGQGDILKDQQRHWVGFGSIGIAWVPLAWIDFKLQVDGHTPFYSNSHLKQINSSSAQLNIGGTLHFSERISLDLAVIEDIIVDTAPDVVFHSALNWRF